VTESIAAFAERLRETEGRDIWMMGGGEIIARRHRSVRLDLISVRNFPNEVVELHYRVQKAHSRGGKQPNG
jgi:dihydrofolate reductase